MGLSLEQAIELFEEMEDSVAAVEHSVSAGAMRTRKWREQKAISVTRDVTGDVTETRHGDVSHVGAGAQVVIPFSSSLRSEELGGGGGGGAREADQPNPDDWPAGNASAHAELLIQAVASPWLDPQKSPDLVTTRGRIAAWKRDGASWEHDVLAVVIGLCANRRAKVSSWKFFDAAVSRSIADNRAALEIPEASGRRQTGPPSWVDQIAATNAEARRRVLSEP